MSTFIRFYWRAQRLIKSVSVHFACTFLTDMLKINDLFNYSLSFKLNTHILLFKIHFLLHHEIRPSLNKWNCFNIWFFLPLKCFSFRNFCTITKSVNLLQEATVKGSPKWNITRHYNNELTFWTLAVSLRSTSFKIKKFYMPLACVECFVRISEQTATFALYIINWLAFITVVGSVYCAVRTDSLYKADYVSSLKG